MTDGVFLKGTTFDILGVTQIYGSTVAGGKVGKTTSFLYKKYMERVSSGEDY